MKKQEYYDPNLSNFHFHSSKQERVSKHTDRYYEKLKDNKKRTKRGLLILFADLLVLVLITVFIFVGRPVFLSRDRVADLKFHIQILNSNENEEFLYAMLKIKNEGDCELKFINLEAIYGDSVKKVVLQLPKKGTMVGEEIIFELNSEINNLDVNIKIGEELGKVQALTKKVSFFFKKN